MYYIITTTYPNYKFSLLIQMYKWVTSKNIN